MKINNKGFLLVETLVTTCIIAILATSIYIYVNSTIINYEKRETYDNITDVYKTNNIKLYLYNHWSELGFSDSSLWLDGINTIELPESIKEKLKISSVFVTLNDSNLVDKGNIIDKTNNKAFKEYIRLLSFVGETTDYRLIVHFKDNKENTFASLVLKLPS